MATRHNDITRLYFVRHARPDNSVHNERERPLTAGGRRDAIALAKTLSAIRFDYLYSSPYMRAVQTIEPLAAELGVGIEIVDSFRERKVAEEWIDDFDAYAARQWEDFSYKLPGGESLSEVQSRAVEVVNAICGKISGKTAAIATHGTVLSVIINHFDDSFGYQGFLDIAPLMPLVIKAEFESARFLGWSHVPAG